jgi:hypothetical protein
MGWPLRYAGSMDFSRRCTVATEAAASAVGVVTALRSVAADWPDELWTTSVSLFDAVIRTWYGVYEFTDDPSCVLRVGLSPARATISLSDGTRIQMGELVGTLHFWNEHLPRYPVHGPDLRWACIVRNQVLHSLRALAVYVESEPAWRHVRGEAALPTRLGIPQVRRVAERFGFERVSTDFPLRRRLHAFGESFTLWALTRAFNPAAIQRQPFLRDHHELWISRPSLLDRYARPRGRTVSARAIELTAVSADDLAGDQRAE